jgi:hypothetical protein
LFSFYSLSSSFYATFKAIEHQKIKQTMYYLEICVKKCTPISVASAHSSALVFSHTFIHDTTLKSRTNTYQHASPEVKEMSSGLEETSSHTISASFFKSYISQQLICSTK